MNLILVGFCVAKACVAKACVAKAQKPMGLKGGATGVKAQFKSLFGGAFRSFDQLQSARDHVFNGIVDDGESPRSRTAVLLDGNVLMMSVSEMCNSMNDFTEIVFNSVRDAFRAAEFVIVVFDEPTAMPNAKREEQAARDAHRAARSVTTSDDIAVRLAIPDGFDAGQLDLFDDVHALKSDRNCRSRLYDETIKRVLERMVPLFELWDHKGRGRCELVIDGSDPRGCARAADEPRAPAIFGTNDVLASKFFRAVPIGEGDIKLIALENRIRLLKSGGSDGTTAVPPQLAKLSLVMTSTVDTDSFMTMVLDVAKRRVDPYTTALHSLFCMRELASKRQREEDRFARATYLCVDVSLLEGHLQTHVWSQAIGRLVPTPTQMLNAMLALSASAAMCGCDFTRTGLKGSRFDHFLESIPEFVSTEPTALESFASALSNDATVAKFACDGLYKVCVAASKHMLTKKRYKAQASNVLAVSETMLLRSIWTTGYWSQVERPSDNSAGFG